MTDLAMIHRHTDLCDRVDWIERYRDLWYMDMDNNERHIMWLGKILTAFCEEHDYPQISADDLVWDIQNEIENIEELWRKQEELDIVADELNIAKLGIQFVIELNEWIDIAGWNRYLDAIEINEANDIVPDLCDANQALLDAFEKVFDREARLLDDGGEPDNALMHEAWDFAKLRTYFH